MRPHDNTTTLLGTRTNCIGLEGLSTVFRALADKPYQIPNILSSSLWAKKGHNTVTEASYQYSSPTLLEGWVVGLNFDTLIH